MQQTDLLLTDTDFVYYDRGAYGTVFVNAAKTRVRKVFRIEQDRAHASLVFQAEADAYAKAMSVPEVAELVPGHFRVCPISAVVDSAKRDVTPQFYSDLAFEAEFIPGCFHKRADSPISEAELQRVEGLFGRAGILYTSDASFLLCPAGKVLKVIDFQTVWHEPMHSF
jgi:hypothetical protein